MKPTLQEMFPLGCTVRIKPDSRLAETFGAQTGCVVTTADQHVLVSFGYETWIPWRHLERGAYERVWRPYVPE